MDVRTSDTESLTSRIQQLEQERDELHKDIEQLCFQKGGPSYLAVATRLHFQRTAGLEQEIENLKKKLVTCTRDNMNLQEELSEVYHIKSQLADLHSAEVSKVIESCKGVYLSPTGSLHGQLSLQNVDAEKQLKFFQGCVASAFAERDKSLMEAESAKESEEAMSKTLADVQKRVQELTVDCLEEKKLHTTLQIEQEKLKEQNEKLKKVITKFYEIRQSSVGCTEYCDLEEKCECLLQDAPDLWSFDNSRESSTSGCISMLEKELEMLRNSVDNLQSKLRMGLEIEDHLKRKVYELETAKILSYDLIKNRTSELHNFHTRNRYEVMSLLEQEKTWFISKFNVLQERIGELRANRVLSFRSLQDDEKIDDIECRDVHITTDTNETSICQTNAPDPPGASTDGERHTSDVIAQALQEKVAALLLLSQEEERHLLDTNVNAALQKKMEELQRNLLQVTNEKVKALVELAQLRQEYQVLQENVSYGFKQGNPPTDFGDKSVVAPHVREEGKLKNLLKKSYLSRWVGKIEPGSSEAIGHMNNSQGHASNNKANYSADFARMKVENAALKESIESLEHLTSSIHRLRLSLVKVKDSATSPECGTFTTEALNGIISEAKVVKTALGSSLPVSWLAEAETTSSGGILTVHEPTDDSVDSNAEKVDFVSASGLEMVELLIMAAQVMKDGIR